jgi:predicted nucleic acid-binding protein
MRVLLDNDVIQDFVQQRLPLEVEANAIFERSALGEFEIYIAPITPVNVFYVMRKLKGRSVAFQALNDLFKSVEVCEINKSILFNALSLNFADYEDAVQHACAESENLDAIVTRNLSDYKNASLPVYSPAEFLNFLKTS